MRISSRTGRQALASSVILIVVFAIGAFHATPAKAYGPLALWQIGMSFNCNNPSVCGSQLGGFWGWAEFDSDNTGDAQLTGCSHLQGGRAAGAQHFGVDVTGWTIANGDFIVTSEIDRYTGRSGGPPIVITIPSEFMDTGIPATAGHYNSLTVFGLKAPPGTNFEVQVTQLHH